MLFFTFYTANAQAKDYESAAQKPILLSSPQKLLEMVNANTFKVQNVVLLIIFESSRIAKSQEYKEVIFEILETQIS